MNRGPLFCNSNQYESEVKAGTPRLIANKKQSLPKKVNDEHKNAKDQTKERKRVREEPKMSQNLFGAKKRTSAKKAAKSVSAGHEPKVERAQLTSGSNRTNTQIQSSPKEASNAQSLCGAREN